MLEFCGENEASLQFETQADGQQKTIHENGAFAHEQIVAVVDDDLNKWLLDLRPMHGLVDFGHSGRVVGSSKRERGTEEQKTSHTQRRKLILCGCNLTAELRVIYKGITEMAAQPGGEWLSRHLQKVGLVAAAVAFVGNCG